jgi:hypothetical protein
MAGLAAGSGVVGSRRDPRHDVLKLPTKRILGNLALMPVLERHPELDTGAEIARQAQCGVGGRSSCTRDQSVTF